jgi:hypothetical protein
VSNIFCRNSVVLVDQSPCHQLMQLTEHECELVATTWTIIKTNNPRVCEYVYSRIVQACPLVSAVFEKRTVSTYCH